jgi:MFS transporter, DHA1 family, multidrug resistance protein
MCYSAEASFAAGLRLSAAGVATLRAARSRSETPFAKRTSSFMAAFGRRGLVLVGLGGAGAAQVLFAFADSLVLLYTARLLGGLFSSATVPAAAAHVADTTAAKDRTSRMAWLGTAVRLGAMVGPVLGGLLAGSSSAGHTVLGGTLIPAWAAPFLVAAGVTALAFLVALAWLPDRRGCRVRRFPPRR